MFFCQPGKPPKHKAAPPVLSSPKALEISTQMRNPGGFIFWEGVSFLPESSRPSLALSPSSPTSRPSASPARPPKSPPAPLSLRVCPGMDGTGFVREDQGGTFPSNLHCPRFGGGAQFVKCSFIFLGLKKDVPYSPHQGVFFPV